MTYSLQFEINYCCPKINPWNLMKIKLNPFWSQFTCYCLEIQFKSHFDENSEKISYFPTQKWDKNKNNGFGFDGQNLIIKLANFEWKSMKNQWKLNEIFAQNSEKILANLIIKFNQNQWNLIINSWTIPVLPLTQNWEKISEKS